MSLNNLLHQLSAKQIFFLDVLAFIEANYNYTPSAFKNGNQQNAATENQGSARVLFFAKINNLSKEDTLSLFAEHYDAVLNSPEGNDHQNIRQFMANGWDTVSFDNAVLFEK
ncbi:HopJ type III effector protein [Sphingobacterium composti Ten et al. 2007 non Yoo et al. 2007]|uniref:HopJ type III effector protein n=1 Tax=Sphingobacterium composti TaxID=363260 RepID=UPI001358B7DF|nr:HopJ type III effector protein [Sphingobacterium composti Ten et al. 2007 non Yoo et al. 2007]